MASNLRVATALGVTFLLLLWTWVGGAAFAAHHPPGSTALTTSASTADWINVTVTDALSFTVTTAPLSAQEITPGDTVHVTLTDLGTVAHTFTLSPTPNYQFPTSDSTQDLETYFGTNAPLVNLTVDGTQGQVATGTFTAPTTGEYEYVCLEPTHFQGGMWGILGSGEAGTGAGGAGYNGPGAPVFIITGTITALVIIALVLGFVIGKRRGSSDEMPPERLGYPEPPAPAPLPVGPAPPQQKT